MVYILLLLLGFILLIGGAHVLVNMCVLFAQRLGVPPAIIGTTVLAFGTSLPELIVGLSASVSGANAMVFGNVVGSNILNVLVMLGLCALIYPCVVSRQSMRVDIPLSILAALMMLALPFVKLPFERNDTHSTLYFSRFDGLLLLVVFVFFMVHAMRIFTRSEGHEGLEAAQGEQISIVKNTLGFIIGLVALIAGGRIIVLNALGLATLLGVSTRIISIVVVALGTSLPELAVSVASAYKRHSELALGNVVGSNIFNAFFILGTCVLISPIAAPRAALVDLVVHAFSVSLLSIIALSSKTHTISRVAGGAFLLLYALYMVQLFT